MHRAIALTALLLLSGCASMPDTPDEAATKRFEKCMDSTLPTFGPVTIATADQRIRAAEVCRTVMTPTAGGAN